MRRHNLFRRKLAFPALCLVVGVVVFGVTYSLLGLSLGTTETNSDEDFMKLWTVIDTRGDATQLRKVLQAGADPNAVSSGGDPILCAAIYRKDHDPRTAYGLVKALLDYGANPNQVDSDGRTPMHWAATYGTEAIMKALLQAGGDPLFGIGSDVPTPFDRAIAARDKGVLAAIKQFTDYRPPHLAVAEKSFGFQDALDEIFNSPTRLTEEEVEAIVRKGVKSMVLSGLEEKKREKILFQSVMKNIRKRITRGEIPNLEHLRNNLRNNTDGE